MTSALKGSGSSREWRSIRALVLREEPVCRWCKWMQSTTVDHIVPRANGGDDRRENLCGACMPCNLARAARRKQAAPSADW